MGKFKNQSKWLWKDKEVQEDLLILKENYENLGLNFTLEDCYNLWFYYSESLAANWLHPSGVEDSLRYMDRILLKGSENELTKREVLEQQDKELNNLMDQYNKLLEKRCLTAFDLVAEELKGLDHCVGLILTGSNGDFEFAAIENDEILKTEINIKDKLDSTDLLMKYDNLRGIQTQIYDEEELEDIKSWKTIVKEIWFER